MSNLRLLPLALFLSACAGGGGGGTPWEGSPSQAMFYQGLSTMNQRPAYASPPARVSMPITTDCTRLSAYQVSCQSF